MPTPNSRPCARCGIQIEFIIGPKDRPIPAHRVKSVYRSVARGGGGLVLEKVQMSELFLTPAPFYVNHFETCPYASEFSEHEKERAGL